MNISSTSDEKIMAALVHGSVLLVFLGPVVPVILWATQRQKSKYVSFHALQAMGYQVLTFWLWIVVMTLIMILTICLAFPLSIFIVQDSQNAALAPLIVQIFMFTAIFGCIGLFFLLGLVGAVSCLLGRDFRYPILGKWLERYLSDASDTQIQLDERREGNWVASMCHATAILQLWGVITPLIVWFTQKERSAHLRFQSMQAFVYQAIAFVTYMLGMALYMLFFFGMFFTLILGGNTGPNNELQGAPAALMMVFMVVVMIFWLVMMILIPIYYLLAGFASIRVVRGHHFHYPILGKIIENRLEKSHLLETTP